MHWSEVMDTVGGTSSGNVVDFQTLVSQNSQELCPLPSVNFPCEREKQAE
jgi:hypothetical protein